MPWRFQKELRDDRASVHARLTISFDYPHFRSFAFTQIEYLAVADVAFEAYRRFFSSLTKRLELGWS